MRSAYVPERLTFNYGHGTVGSKSVIDAALAHEPQPTFATAEFAEPRDWGYLGLLAFTAMLLMRPQDLVPGLSSLHLAEVCAVLGIAPMVIHRLARRLPVFQVTPETTGLLFLGCAMLAAVPFSVWPGGALRVFTDLYLKVLIVCVLMMNTLTSSKRVEQITWLIVVCCGWVACLSIVSYLRGDHLVENGRLAGAISGIFGNPNDLAANMVTFFPAATILAITPSYPTSRRLAAAVIAVLMLTTVVLTKSRGGALGLLVTLAALVLLGSKVRRGFGLMVIAAVLAAVPLLPSTFWARMSSITDDKIDREEFTGSREARRILMQEGLDVFLQFPLTGVGPGQFENYNPPERQEKARETHNSLLQVASETGIFGLLAFSFLIVRAFMGTIATRRLLSRPRGKGAADPIGRIFGERDRRALYALTVAMTCGLIGWFVCSLFASVAYSWTFYYLLALIVSARELTQHRLRAAMALESDRVKAFSVLSGHFPRRLAARA